MKTTLSLSKWIKDQPEALALIEASEWGPSVLEELECLCSQQCADALGCDVWNVLAEWSDEAEIADLFEAAGLEVTA